MTPRHVQSVHQIKTQTEKNIVNVICLTKFETNQNIKVLKILHFGKPKGLFTPSVGIDTHIDTWKEYVDFDYNIHTKSQHQHQHKCQQEALRLYAELWKSLFKQNRTSRFFPKSHEISLKRLFHEISLKRLFA